MFARTDNVTATNVILASLDGEVVTEYDQAGAGSPALKNSFVSGGLHAKATRIPASGGRAHYLGDQVGTLAMTLADTGATLETVVKDAYGVAIAGSTVESYQGINQAMRIDGLDYMHNRMYDPNDGRFTQTDPILGNRASMHYVYGANNPLRMVDPFGLAPEDWWDPRTICAKVGTLVLTRTPKPVLDFVVQSAVGFVEVQSPTQPPGGFDMPSSGEGLTGRITGRTLGILAAGAEIHEGAGMVLDSETAGVALALPTGGTVEVPAQAVAAVGVGLAIQGVFSLKRASDLPAPEVRVPRSSGGTAKGGGTGGGGGGKVPNKGSSRYEQLVNKENRISNETAAGGDRGIKGTVNPAEADFLGERFVGEGFTKRIGPKGERILISKNGLRQYRSPTPKTTTKTETGTQANFQSRSEPEGEWTSNVHLDIEE
jgi:RHS repeat-associated protein